MDSGIWLINIAQVPFVTLKNSAFSKEQNYVKLDWVLPDFDLCVWQLAGVVNMISYTCFHDSPASGSPDCLLLVYAST